MFFLLLFLGIGFLITFWIGYRHILQLRHLNKKRVLIGAQIGLFLLLLLFTAEWLHLIPRDIARGVTMFLYSGIAGFFLGYALRVQIIRNKAMKVEYVYRSHWTETAPSLLAVTIIVFGLYQTNIFWLGPFTGLGVTSGLSLIGFGCWGVIVKIVPEFRYQGILILDQLVPWDKIISYRWQSEEVLEINYYNEEQNITQFTTYIPSRDRYQVEQLLGKRLMEAEDDNKQKAD